MQDITNSSNNRINDTQRIYFRTRIIPAQRRTPPQINARPPREPDLPGEMEDAPPEPPLASRPRVVASERSVTRESGLRGCAPGLPRPNRTGVPDRLMSHFRVTLTQTAAGPIADMLGRVKRDGAKGFIDFMLRHWEEMPTMRSAKGRSVLAELVLAGQPEAVDHVLRSKNADEHLRAQSSGGANALMYAAQEGMVGMVQKLLSVSPALAREQLGHRVDGNNALMVAAAEGHADVVRLLLQDPALAVMQLDCRSQTGESALMYAAANGHLETVKALLQGIWDLANGGEDLEPIYRQTGARNGRGERALELACKYGEQEIARLLAPLTPAIVPAGGQVDWRHRPW